jgi:hypothetical protein
MLCLDTVINVKKKVKIFSMEKVKKFYFVMIFLFE